MPPFDDVFAALKGEVAQLARSSIDDFQDEALQDGIAFLTRTRDNLERWTRLMQNGSLSNDEVASLVRGQKDLAEMQALKEAGLAAAEVDRFRNALLDRIVSTLGRLL